MNEEELPTYKIYEYACCFRCQRQGAVNYKGWTFYCPDCHEQVLKENDE